MKTVTLLAVVAGGFCVAWMHFPPSQPSIRLVNGAKDFRQYCARCHSLDPAQRKYGPSLHNIGSVAAQRVAGDSASTYLWNSILRPNDFRASEGSMPESFGRELGPYRTRDILAFLMARSGIEDLTGVTEIPAEARDLNEVKEGPRFNLTSIEKGRRLFLGRLQCGNCHKLNPAHAADHLAGPNLDGIGFSSRDELASSMRRPSSNISPSYQTSTCLVDGAVYTGRVLSTKTDSITLLEQKQDGWKLRDIPRAETSIEVRTSSASLMPEFSAEVVSDRDMSSLLDFLQMLR